MNPVFSFSGSIPNTPHTKTTTAHAGASLNATRIAQTGPTTAEDNACNESRSANMLGPQNNQLASTFPFQNLPRNADGSAQEPPSKAPRSNHHVCNPSSSRLAEGFGPPTIVTRSPTTWRTDGATQGPRYASPESEIPQLSGKELIEKAKQYMRLYAEALEEEYSVEKEQLTREKKALEEIIRVLRTALQEITTERDKLKTDLGLLTQT
ncbi:hypothetical protein BJX66DRAFT_345354 [Aspergillus keveii]|uniref:Uncharacterized protein n=1 Tax=Aspergillus keveii TaxID=714993 RepID=A0ABR4FIC3_9EURO